MSEHKCSDPECPYVGQASATSCACHLSEVESLRAENIALKAERDALAAENARLAGSQIVRLIDQDGTVVGARTKVLADLLVEHAHRDATGTVWTQPTAWAYRQACRALDGHRTRATAAEASAAALAEALRDAESALTLGQAGDPVLRATELQGRALEDPAVFALCERHGYGAVMASASRQWLLKDKLGGEFLVGPCLATWRNVVAKIHTALELHS